MSFHLSRTIPSICVYLQQPSQRIQAGWTEVSWEHVPGDPTRFGIRINLVSIPTFERHSASQQPEQGHSQRPVVAGPLPLLLDKLGGHEERSAGNLRIEWTMLKEHSVVSNSGSRVMLCFVVIDTGDSCSGPSGYSANCGCCTVVGALQMNFKLC